MKKILIVILVLAFSFTRIIAQSIRKDYREFTQQEMTDYVAALNILFSNGTITAFQNEHSNHGFGPIHTIAPSTGEQFLSWHRFFLIDMEVRLKATNSSYAYLNIPYWNWTTDQNSGLSQFWNNGFLNKNNNFPTWPFTRNVGAGGSLASPSALTGVMNLTTFYINTTTKNATSTDFSHRWEHYHDNVHGWVGGTMNNVLASPGDPVFYLHHGMVDKVWQDWEDRNTAIQSSFPNGNTAMEHYNTTHGYPFNVTSNMMIDSRNLTRPAFSGSGRNMDVWYAENGKVLLDGANGSPFIATDASVAYTYRYTAATAAGASTFTGSMYVGDVQKDAAGNVIDDNKGGFEINNTVKVNFLSGREIIFKNGFWAKNGSQMVAKIITTPNEPGPLLRPAQNPVFLTDKTIEKEGPEELMAVKIFPNPIKQRGILQYGLKEAALVEITLTDVLGRTIKVIEKGVRYPGNYTTDINTVYLPHGIYFCKVLIGKHIRVIKIVK